MARIIKTRIRSALPGSGFDSAGNAKQGKRRVVGEISVTSYTSAGEKLTAADLGLSTIDFISLRHEDQAGAKEGKEARHVLYNSTSSDFYIVKNTGATVATGGATNTIFFSAEGDALDGTELT